MTCHPTIALGLALAVLAASGCGGRSEPPERNFVPSDSLPGSVLPARGGLSDSARAPAYGDSSRTVQPAVRAADIVSQIHEQMSQLKVAIASGRMNDVRARALAVRALAAALPSRAAGPHAAEVRRAAAAIAVATRQLDEAARAGDRATLAEADAQLRRDVQAVARAVPNH